MLCPSGLPWNIILCLVFHNISLLAHLSNFLILALPPSRTTQASPREGNGTPLQYSCLEKSHGQRSLVGFSPWGCKESDTTERLHFHFSLSCIGEGNGNPLHCSCLENPQDRGAWWAAIYEELDTTEAT